MVELSSVLTVSPDKKTISIRKSKVESSALTDDGYWLNLYQSFISTLNEKIETSFECLLDFYSERVRQSYISALNSDNQFFTIVDGVITVSDSNVVFSKNRMGEFIQPDFDLVVDTISQSILKLEEVRSLGQSNFDIYQEAFLEKWKPKKGTHAKKRTMLELYQDSDYCEDLTEWMTQSRSQLAINYIQCDIAICSPMISSVTNRLQYMKSEYENLSSYDSNAANSLHSSIQNCMERLEHWNYRVEVNNLILSEINNSTISKKESLLVKEIENLEEQRRSLRIPTRHFDAHQKIQSWALENGGSLEVDVAINNVEDIASSIRSKGASTSSSDYHTLYNFYNYHPFKVALNKKL
jgi:hypothetical protein